MVSRNRVAGMTIRDSCEKEGVKSGLMRTLMRLYERGGVMSVALRIEISGVITRGLCGGCKFGLTKVEGRCCDSGGRSTVVV